MNTTSEQTNLSPTKRALLALKEMQSKLDALERAKTEPIAIIGIGCRFPGGADNPEAFWHLLRDGVNAITEVPSDRWDIDAYYDPDPDAPGKMYTRYGGFLGQVDTFDPQFFGISPREAVSLDPQQRLLLEVSWEALENANQVPEQLFSSSTGVFIGICANDYSKVLSRGMTQTPIDAYFGTGNALSVAAGRLSYTLGLTGPSMAVDTACSSSLVAVHLACQSLRSRECDLALVGGVNLLLAPEASINFSKARMMAADGRCKTFDAAADGYVRGEGCGVIVLKRLSAAVADADNILAVIRGSAVNQDGPSGGLTVPSGPSQQAVIRQALDNAGVKSSQVSYVEAHGTGTFLGDPIEVGALGAVFGKDRPQDNRLVIGSVKTNIGHLEAAAGIAGLIKVVLSLQHEEIPPHLNFKQPNPHITWDELPAVIPTERIVWPSGERRRLAGVSSFSFSGTNAHIVLEEAPVLESVQADVERPLHLLTLSAKTEDALKQLAGRHEQHLATAPALAIGDVCFSANTCRSQFKYRLSVVGSLTSIREKLAAFTAGQEPAGVFKGQVQGSSQPKIGFFFTGQGSQYIGMGRQLYEQAPTFRQTLDKANEILLPYLEKPLLEVLYPSEGEMGELVYAQTALFALEYALVELWKSWGIEPSVVMGDGVGEYVAACVAGVLSLEDCLQLIALRGRLMQDLPQDDEMVAMLAARVGAAIQSDAAEVVTAGLVTTEIANPIYWCRSVGQPVSFAAAIETLQQQGCEVFIEIGLRPHQSDWHPLLQSLGELYVRGVPIDWSGFDRDYARRRVVLPTYPFQRQRYWVEQKEVDYHKTILLSSDGAGSRLLHPLLGQRLHLAESEEIRFESQISQQEPAFLEHHRIYQTAIVPATAYLEMALAAGAAVFKSDNLVLEEVFIQQVLILPEEERKTLQLIWKPDGLKASSFQIFSLSTDEENSEPSWTLHACGKVLEQGASGAEGQRGRGAEGQRGRGERELPSGELASLQARYEEISVKDYYQQFRELGIDYGPRFQAIEQLWRDEGQALGQIRLPEGLDLEAEDYQLHPVLLDACFQLLGAALSAESHHDAYVPLSIESLQIYRRPDSRLWGQVQMLEAKGASGQLLRADLSLFNANQAVVAQVKGLCVKSVSREALQRVIQKEDLGNCLYQIAWEPQTRDFKQLVDVKQPGSWLIFADEGGMGQKLANRLKERGDRCVLVKAGQIYQRSEGEHYQINPLEPLDFQRLLQDLIRDCQPPYRGIVHLWSLSETLGNKTTISALQDGQTLGCGSVLHLVQALAPARWTQLQRLLLVTRGAQPVEATPLPLQVQQATLWGLGRVIALEHPEMHCACLDLERSPEEDEISTLVAELCFPDRELQIAYRQGVRHVARLVRRQPGSKGLQQTGYEPFQLKISSSGILENLTLAPMTRRQPGPGEVEIQVCATGLNFRDVLNALGMLQAYSAELGIESTAEMPFGGECAGKIVAVGENVADIKVGDEVIAAQAIGSFSSFVTLKAEFVAPKPQDLSFEEAATIPIAFLTAYYGLHHLAKIQPRDRILIHAAAGGVGQAAVQLAQRAGAEVLATASPSKWEFLKSIGVEQVMNSRTLDFAEEVMAITQGQGVNIVFNSLNGEFITKNFEVLGQGGRFIEIGKIGIWDQRQVQELRPDVSYFPFDLLDRSLHNPSLIAAMLKELMQDFRQSTLKPLPHKVFPIENVVNAFRYMAQAKHIGKVVVSVPSMTVGADILDREPVRSDSSYLITGGLGALGLKVAHWMVEQGARHLILVGRRGATDAAKSVDSLLAAGAQVLVAQVDVSKQEDVARVLETVQASMPPLRGIVHAAGVLDDGVLLQQNWERFSRVMAPKVQGAWNLHTLTQNLPLDFFVCFSSAAALLGSPGQGNYAAANAFMDALAHHRQALGKPSLSINWGPWADAGMAAGMNYRNQTRWAAQGVSSIAPQQGLQVLKELLAQGTQVGVLPINWSKFLGQFSQDLVSPFLDAFTSASRQPLTQRSEFLQHLEAAPVNERRSLLTDHIRSQITQVLGLSSPEPIDLQQGFSELGMDSLMAVELRNRLQTSLGCSISSTLAFDYPTVEGLVNYLALEVLSIEPFSESVAQQDVSDRAELSATLEELSQSEIADLLAQELAAIEEINGR